MSHLAQGLERSITENILNANYLLQNYLQLNFSQKNMQEIGAGRVGCVLVYYWHAVPNISTVTLNFWFLKKTGSEYECDF